MKKRVIGAVVGAVALAILVVVGIAAYPMLTQKNRGDSGQELSASELTPVTQVSATGADGRTRQVEILDAEGGQLQPDTLQAGDVVTVRGSGFDAATGIYVSFCKLALDGERPSPCLGKIPASKEAAAAAKGQVLAAAWITDAPIWAAFATHGYDDPQTGAFEVQLTVPEGAMEGLDCTVAGACGLTTRSDHTNASDRVQDLQIPIVIAK